MVAIGYGAFTISLLAFGVLESKIEPRAIAYTAPVEVIEPREVQIRIVVDWTPERIEQGIRETFPEDPETAVKIARCESGLVPDIQSHHTVNGVREASFGIFQIHAPSWHSVAMKLGHTNYQSEVEDNLAMARHIYDSAGKSWKDWSCYTKKMI